MNFILIAILIYLAYQFIFKLVIPVYIASRRIKKGFSEMKSRMEEQYSSGNKQPFTATSPGNKAYQPKADEYIEFEEIK